MKSTLKQPRYHHIIYMVGVKRVILSTIDHGEDDVGAATLLGGSVEKKVHYSSIGVLIFRIFYWTVAGVSAF